VLQASALTGAGVDAFWFHVEQFRATQQASNEFARRRQRQAERWMWDLIHAGLRQRFAAHPAVRAVLPHTTAGVRDGRVAAGAAARALLAAFNEPMQS
jgi:LAO/AO transport system kinase